jgi:hypothetical protein
MLQAAILSGDGLQGLAYAMAAGQPEDRGRYLFIKPDLDGSTRVSVEMSPEDPDVVRAFRQTVAAAMAIWKKGTFIPRLSKPDENSEPDRCKYCDVAEACSRGDSGARTRLRGWSEARLAAGVDETVSDSDDETVSRLWFLSSKRRLR